MHEAIRTMLSRYACSTADEYVAALHEILQELALLGLWRARFFEVAAFYGGTVLRVLHGLDRFSEDLDFSLLDPEPGFSLRAYGDALVREIASFGFDVELSARVVPRTGPIESAFLKANTARQLVVAEVDSRLLDVVHPHKTLKIRLEIDTDPPGGFSTESRYVLQPIPFAVRAYSLPDLFAGKLHAVLCRTWKTRVKGRDWYDLVWYVGRGTPVRIAHLEARMRQSGDYSDSAPLTESRLAELLADAVAELDVSSARAEVSPFLRDPRSVEVWSRDFFLAVVARIESA